MRVVNNILALNTYFEPLNKGRNEEKNYTIPKTNYDTVNFFGRKPKDGIKALQKATKTISNTTKGTGKRHIKNSMHAQLNIESQKQIENMHKNLDIINEFFQRLKTNQPKAERIKRGYQSLITGTKKHGLTFKMPYPDNGNTITLTKSKTQPNLIRIVITNQKGEEAHTLLDGFDKVVGNLNKKSPQFMPTKLRYMTVAELDQSPAKKYIHIANTELEKFTQYLGKVAQDNPIKTRKNKISSTATKSSNIGISPALSREQSVSKLLDIFDKRTEEIPSHINAQISPSSKKVVIFSLKTEDGGTLKVSKRINPEYGSDLRYVTIEKLSPEGDKYCLSIDLETKEILKCNKFDGKPIIVNDCVCHYTPEELKKYGIEDKFNNFMTEIYRTPKETDTHQEITILKMKEKPQTKPKIEDIDVSEFEDSNITKQVAKEETTKLSDNTEHQTNDVKPEQTETIQQTKKRGRKPKTQNTNSQPTTNQSTTSTEKFKADIISKATADANNLADEYYKIFVEQFKKAITEKISEFQSRLNDLIK